MNSITERLHYISNNNQGNQRFIVDIVCEHPDVWQLSKITRRSPFGTNKLGLYKTEFNPETDYIDFENMEMYADYYDSVVEPIEEIDEHKTPGKQSYKLKCGVSTAGKEIKVNGSYKTFTCTATDDSNFDVTDDHYSAILNGWKCYLDGMDITDDTKLVKWLKCKHENQIKLKFLGDLSYIGKVLTIRCCITDTVYGELQLDIKSL